MKLITLKFAGIGSFADQMVIDFERLGSAGLFLVEGPTGSGKSTILDAVVFALYGSVAGADSDIGRLDSHVRDRSQAPYVELVFECGGGRYRIRRTPRHQRDKKRGSGTTDDNGCVTLMQVRPDSQEISHRAREVGDWVVEHIGLTRSQFASTIVLAQGEFATFLDADTARRAQILEKVFGTEFYKDLEEQLAAMRKAALLQRKAAQTSVQEHADRCLGVLGLPPSEQPLASIDEEIARVRRDLAAARGRAEHAGVEVARAKVALASAEALVAAQEHKREYLRRQRELDAAADEVQQMRSALTAHDRARPVQPAASAWESAAERAAEAAQGYEQASTAVAALEVEDVSAAALTACERAIGELAGAAEAEQRLPALLAHVPHLQQMLTDASERCSTLATRRAGISTQIAQARAQSVVADEPRDVLTGLTVASAAVASALLVWDEVDRLQADLVLAQVDAGEAASAQARALASVEQARREHSANHAAALAATLREGQPCLVCGAVEHPQPAQPGTGAAPDLERLEAGEEQTRARLTAATQRVQRIQACIEARLSGIDADRATLLQRRDEIDRELDGCRARVAAVQAARRTVDRLQEESAELAQAGAGAELARQQAGNDLQAVRQQCDELTEQVDRARMSFPSVGDRVVALQRQATAIRDLLTANSALTHARASQEEARLTLTALLDQVGLPDLPTAQAAILPPAREQQLRAVVEEHHRLVAETSAGLAQLREVDPDVVVDLSSLVDDLATKTHAHTEVIAAMGSLAYRLEQAVPLRTALVEALDTLERRLQDTAGVIRMADLATANRSEVVHRVRLSSFVLMRRFQSVVDAANDRLDAISEGRYQLVVEHGGLDNRGLAGLDLLVADQRTEQTRSTRSLSGGERFYVALALALGLADVVRSESGGIELGTLFIDEGFGSLDERTLDEVMDMLEQVRAGQDRIIGLVSHVDLLKRRIDPRISVRRDGQRPGVSRLEVRV